MVQLNHENGDKLKQDDGMKHLAQISEDGTEPAQGRM
jgi:hypothetical protein